MSEQKSASALPQISTKTADLVRTGMAKVASGEVSFNDLIDSVRKPEKVGIVSKEPPRSQALTEDVLAAIKALPEVFGQVKVDKDRALTKPEAKALIEERDIIDTVMGVLKKRKDEVIREYLANHMDHVYQPEGDLPVRTDPKGHTAPYETQNFEVEGTTKKIQRFASGGKPQVAMGTFDDLLAEGRIDRATYNSLTTQVRVLDMGKVTAACKKDPALFVLIASAAKPSALVTTVKVEKA